MIRQFAAVLTAAAGGFVARSELWRLHDRRKNRRHRVMLPSDPHKPTSEYPWPGCWCGDVDNPAHQASGAER